jgi:hypothetical protein
MGIDFTLFKLYNKYYLDRANFLTHIFISYTGTFDWFYDVLLL